jgi:hypothetical protein
MFVEYYLNNVTLKLRRPPDYRKEVKPDKQEFEKFEV